VRVPFHERGGSGGGGAGRPAGEELADLFQLEMDKLRNQYETASGLSTDTENQVDEMLER